MLPDISYYNSFTPQPTTEYNNEVLFHYDTILIINHTYEDPEDTIYPAPGYNLFKELAKDWFLEICGKSSKGKYEPYFLFHKTHLIRQLNHTSLRYKRQLVPYLLHANYLHCSNCGNSAPSILITAPAGLDLITPTTTPGIYTFLNTQFITFKNLVRYTGILHGYNPDGVLMHTTKIPPYPDSTDISVLLHDDHNLTTLETKLNILATIRLAAYIVATATIQPQGGGMISNALIKDLFTPVLEPLESINLTNIDSFVRR